MRAPTELEQKWLDLLRSGTIKQGHKVGYGSIDRRMCCLNVAAVAMGYPFGNNDRKWGDLSGGTTYDKLVCVYPVLRDGQPNPRPSTGTWAKCVHMNDVDRASFTEIADYIEQQIAQSDPLPEPEPIT